MQKALKKSEIAIPHARHAAHMDHWNPPVKPFSFHDTYFNLIHDGPPSLFWREV